MLYNHALFALALSIEVILPVCGATAVAGVVLSDRPDIALLDSLTAVRAVGAEPMIAVDPTNWRVLLATYAVALNQEGATKWYSVDGGLNWHGSNTSVHSKGGGDPWVAIVGAGEDFPKRFMIMSIGTKDSDPVESADGTQRVVYSSALTAANSAWDQSFPAPVAEQQTDKGFLYANNALSVPVLFSLWIKVATAEPGVTRFARSLDGGVTWVNKQSLTPRKWGGAIAAGITSTTTNHVYVAIPAGGEGGNLGPPDRIDFLRSTNTGVSFGSVTTAVTFNDRSFGYPYVLPGGLNVDANSAPSLATDDQGNLYMAWCEKRVASGDGGDAQIYVKKSSPDATHLPGDVWGSPVLVSSNSANQWTPEIAWDNAAKALSVVYYDDRAEPDSAYVYLAVSYDRGASFAELRISDAQGSGGGLLGAFVGDYMGLTSAAGVAYPLWCDNRVDGVAKPYISPVYVGGVVGDSITVAISPGALSNTLRFVASWRTRVASDGLDRLTVTPPGASAIARTLSGITSASHEIAVDSIACGSSGSWSYVVESNKGAAVSRSGTLTVSNTIQVSQSSVSHSNVQALVDSMQVTVTWTTNIATQAGADVVRFYTAVSGGTEIATAAEADSTSNGGLTHTAVCKITPCVAQQYFYYTATSVWGCTSTSARETSKRFKVSACVEE